MCLLLIPSAGTELASRQSGGQVKLIRYVDTTLFYVFLEFKENKYQYL